MGHSQHRTRGSSSASSQRPSHWPPDVQYLSMQRYHVSVPKEIRSRLLTPQASANPGLSVSSQRSKPSVIIREVVQESHPACGQRGLFATKRIPPRTHILDYLGEVHCDERPLSDYDLSLYRTPDGKVSVGVDASRMGNEARFINDFRGVRSKPNASFEEHRSGKGELCMSVWSGSEVINKGDEILVSYGKGFWKARSSE